jgi:hypothetical protein
MLFIPASEEPLKHPLCPAGRLGLNCNQVVSVDPSPWAAWAAMGSGNGLAYRVLCPSSQGAFVE